MVEGSRGHFTSGDLMTTTTPRADDATALPIRTLTMGWALKRAVIGIIILFVVIWGAAWLLYSSIDPNLDHRTGAAAPAHL